MEVIGGNRESKDGSVKRDDWNEYTYVGNKGQSVINYVIGKEEVKRKIERMEIGDRVDSDHQLVVLIRGRKTKDGKVEKE